MMHVKGWVVITFNQGRVDLHFWWIRIQQFFWMCIYFQLLFICRSGCSSKKTLWRVFLNWKNIRDCSKVKKLELVQIYLIFGLQLQLLPNSLLFSVFIKKFPSWIRVCIQYAGPDPGGKMNADKDLSGSTALPWNKTRIFRYSTPSNLSAHLRKSHNYLGNKNKERAKTMKWKNLLPVCVGWCNCSKNLK